MSFSKSVSKRPSVASRTNDCRWVGVFGHVLLHLALGIPPGMFPSAIYGEPQKGNLTRSEAVRNFKYPARGISFHVGKNGVIESISVYRPLGKTAKPGEGLTRKPENKIIQSDKSKLLKLSDLGVELPLPASWTTVVPMTEKGGSFAPPSGHMSLSVHVCLECEESLRQHVTRLTTKLSPNQIPKALRGLGDEELKRRNAQSSYLGLHSVPSSTSVTWIIALSRDKLRVAMVIRVKNGSRISQGQKREIVRLFRELKLGQIKNQRVR